MSFQKLLIAVDENPIAAHAIDVGIDLARSLHAQAALVYAIDPSSIYAPEAGMAADELALSAEADGKRLMDDLRARLPADTHLLQFLPRGQPAAEIVKAAKEWGADLIVIGSHGRRGLTRALLGSVAEVVMRHAHCPVLVVRPKA